MKDYSQAQLETMAKRQGFKDYATYAAWHKKYRGKRGKGDAQQPQKKYSNVFERISIHPAGILRRVSDRINEATK